ncbi:MFS transporter [Legionella lansingensis]|nr:MFS transporter [Legionella lansingensis]
MITVFTPMLLHAQGDLLSTKTSMTWRTILLGILLALYPLGQFIGSPVLGALSDHYGRRKILIFSLSLTIFFYFLITLSLYLQNLILLMSSLFLAGLSESNIVVAQGAIADVAEEKERGRLFGYIYLSASSAYVIGPLVGGILANPKLIPWFNDATPFAAICICLIILLMWVSYYFKETLNLQMNQEKIAYLKLLTNFFTIFRANDIRFLFLINFLLYLAIFGFFRCYPMYLVDEFHMQVGQLSQFIAWVAVPIILGNIWLTGFLAQRYLPRNMTIVSAALTGMFMILIVIPNEMNFLWITLFLTSLALAVCLPACATLLSVSAPNEEQGKVMGNNQSLQVLAESLSGVIGGLLAAIIVKLSLIVLAITALFSALLLYINTVQKK